MSFSAVLSCRVVVGREEFTGTNLLTAITQISRMVSDGTAFIRAIRDKYFFFFLWLQLRRAASFAFQRSEFER